ncbi:MAG: phosphodiester glycosidase family protein [Streptococcus vestibularis]|nr:phosphodiester glycosidase family protein [Streptococcus vestibularis]MCY7043479.1 phosphodiester glycosidase family protein [Streptococcus vestibularis]MDU3179634.1 phosphodiester glycosidase family protein [Streptococcus vestibularis]
MLFYLLMIGAIVGGLLYLTIYFNNRDIKKLSMPSDKDGLTFNIENKELLDQSVLLEKGSIKNVDMQILSFKKDGKYVLQKGRTEDNNPELTEQSIKYEANRREALALINSGFWSYEGLDRPFAQKEIKLGKTGLLYGDDQNNITAGTYPNIDTAQMFTHMGSNGWDTGAFGIIVKDKKLDKNWEKGDPDQPNARSIYVETYDGIIRIIQTYGHTSLNKGLNHEDIYNLLKNLGYSNIRLAFLLDGGGTTRMYTRSDNGKEKVVGAFVDDRTYIEYLYLAKRDSNATDPYIWRDQELVKAGKSKSITYKDYIEAIFSNGTVPGTQYQFEISK